MARAKKGKTPKKNAIKKKNTFKHKISSKKHFRKSSKNIVSEVPSSSCHSDTSTKHKPDTSATTKGYLIRSRRRNRRNRKSLLNKTDDLNNLQELADPTSTPNVVTPTLLDSPPQASLHSNIVTQLDAANSTLVTPIVSDKAAKTILRSSKNVTPLSRHLLNDSKSKANKICQKWRKYKNDRLKKATKLAMTGVSPKKMEKTKATIFRLLGDKSHEFGEFSTTDEYDANLLQDLDLVILAASAADYEAYTKLLRQEYTSLTEENYKQMRLKAKEKLKQTFNQTELEFSNFRDEIAKTSTHNSTATDHSRTQNLVPNCSIINSTLNQSCTIEDGEIISDAEENHSTMKRSKKGVIDDDCIVIEKTVEQIIIDDDTPPCSEKDRTEPSFFVDVAGTPSLKFTPRQAHRKSRLSSNRLSCTAVLNNSDVIILDETTCSSTSLSIAHKSLDDSVLFVSESTPDFIPLTSQNVPKPIKVVPNPFSTKAKKVEQSSNDTLFSKSEKKELEAYNFNSYNPKYLMDLAAQKQNQKRMVIIDGCNVAFGHSRGREFSVKGLQICIDYFKKMGHEVKAVVPQMRLQQRYSTDAAALDKLYKEGLVVLTPCKNIPGNSSSSYDDRFILQMASQLDAAIVSNDNYRDFIHENAALKKLILHRVIGYTWVNDLFMLPKDPYGKHGVTLREILYRNPKTNV